MRGKSQKNENFWFSVFCPPVIFWWYSAFLCNINWKYIQSSSIKFMVPPWSIVGGGRVPIGLWNEQDKATCSGCESELWCRSVMMIVLPKMRGHELVTTFETGNERQSPFLMMHESFQIDVLREKTLFKQFCRCGHWKRQSVRLESISWWWIFRNETCWVMTFLESANER